jgi:hypothetical protein
MGHTTSDLLETAQRRAFVLKMRKSGLSYPQIAAMAVKTFGQEALPLGWDERYAYKDVKRELDKLTVEVGEAAEDVRALELQRLDDMLVGLWPQVAKQSPNLGAVDRVLRIMERRAKIVGIDAPTRQELTGKDGGPIETASLSPEQWRAERAKRRKEAEETLELFEDA